MFPIPIDQLKREILGQSKISFVRSSGPGGQNVNKVNSKVQVQWDIQNSRLIPIDVLRRFNEKFHSKMTAEGEVFVACDLFRDQERNLTDAVEKLIDFVRQVWLPPKKRIKTRPTKSSVRKRLEGKKHRSQLKKERKIKIEN